MESLRRVWSICNVYTNVECREQNTYTNTYTFLQLFYAVMQIE